MLMLSHGMETPFDLDLSLRLSYQIMIQIAGFGQQVNEVTMVMVVLELIELLLS